jgi:hypothetical protein
MLRLCTDFKKVRVYLAKQVSALPRLTAACFIRGPFFSAASLRLPYLVAPCFRLAVAFLLCGQSAESVPNPAELQSLADQEAAAKEELTAVQASNTRLSEQLRALQNQPNDEELAKQLVDYKKQVDALNVRLARIKSEGKQVNKAGMNAVQSKFNDAATAWVKRRRAALDLVDMMAGEEGDPKQVIVSTIMQTCACSQT